MKRTSLWLLVLLLAASQHVAVLAQGAGSIRFGATSRGEERARSSELPLLKSDEALKCITIDATVETRIPPEEIRVVLAITSEGETADQCHTQNEGRIRAIVKTWAEQGIPRDKIVEDFINVLPRYEWEIEERHNRNVAVQKKKGYRLQTNLHLAVKTEEQATQAITTALRLGATDVITFDYWSSKLNEQKKTARKKAVQAAKEKADTLLAVFDERPKVVNIQEQTKVVFPRSMYRTSENYLEQEMAYSGIWRDMIHYRAYRPRMTFLDAVDSRADERPAEMVMRPEITVISTVRLYYQSPGHENGEAGDD